MKVVTDTSANLPLEELQAMDICMAPLQIHFPDGDANLAEMSVDEFYRRLAAMYPQIPTTAQPSCGVFANIYRSIAESDREILSVHISSGLSGTINAARLGAEHEGHGAHVTCWDTLTLAGGQRFQVLAAALAARAGWSVQAILERLAEIRDRTEVTFTLDTLEYLARGGRIGRIAGLAGMLLNIKPVIHVAHHDGKYTTVAKSRSVARALTAIVEHMVATYGSTPLWVTVQHGQLAEKAEVLTGQLKDCLNIVKLEAMRVTPVLGVHTGPAIVGAAAVPMSLMEGLL